MKKLFILLLFIGIFVHANSQKKVKGVMLIYIDSIVEDGILQETKDLDVTYWSNCMAISKDNGSGDSLFYPFKPYTLSHYLNPGFDKYLSTSPYKYYAVLKDDTFYVKNINIITVKPYKSKSWISKKKLKKMKDWLF